MLVNLNQHYPFTFQGAADDPAIYAAIQRMTSTRRCPVGWQRQAPEGPGRRVLASERDPCCD